MTLDTAYYAVLLCHYKNQVILAHRQRTEKTALQIIVHKLDVIKKATETDFILCIILGRCFRSGVIVR